MAANGWRRNRKGDLAVNPDLWTRLLELCERQEMRYQWVKGHAGDPENERCDKLSNEALARPNLPVDEQYERAERGPGRVSFRRGVLGAAS